MVLRNFFTVSRFKSEVKRFEKLQKEAINIQNAVDEALKNFSQVAQKDILGKAELKEAKKQFIARLKNQRSNFKAQTRAFNNFYKKLSKLVEKNKVQESGELKKLLDNLQLAYAYMKQMSKNLTIQIDHIKDGESHEDFLVLLADHNKIRGEIEKLARFITEVSPELPRRDRLTVKYSGVAALATALASFTFLASQKIEPIIVAAEKPVPQEAQKVAPNVDIDFEKITEEQKGGVLTHTFLCKNITIDKVISYWNIFKQKKAYEPIVRENVFEKDGQIYVVAKPLAQPSAINLVSRNHPKVQAFINNGKISAAYCDAIDNMCIRLNMNAMGLLSVICFESMETFSSSQPNLAGSGAVGQIQFMPKTAIGLGTTTAKLAKMSQIEQLEYVEKFFLQHKGKGSYLKPENIALAVFYPVAVGKPNRVIAKSGTRRYKQNIGLDRDSGNNDGTITAKEYAQRALQQGFL